MVLHNNICITVFPSCTLTRFFRHYVLYVLIVQRDSYYKNEKKSIIIIRKL